MSADDVSSDEWFVRYSLDAGYLVALLLLAIGVALYLDDGDYLRDLDREPGAGFLVCMVLCPVLGVVTLGLLIYAGIRLFVRPRTFAHALVRLALLAAHACVFLLCIDTISTTTTSLVGSFGRQSSGADSAQVWGALGDRDFSGSQYDVREGSPGDDASMPSGFGPGMGAPAGGRGTTSR